MCYRPVGAKHLGRAPYGLQLVRPFDVTAGAVQGISIRVVHRLADGGERLDFLASDAPLPDEQVSDMIDGERARVWLRDALGALTEREMRIIRARRLSEDGATLEELGLDLGISKERVRQIETRALEKLRVALATKAPALTAGIH